MWCYLIYERLLYSSLLLSPLLLIILPSQPMFYILTYLTGYKQAVAFEVYVTILCAKTRDEDKIYYVS